jgi:hypothetical protein
MFRIVYQLFPWRKYVFVKRKCFSDYTKVSRAMQSVGGLQVSRAMPSVQFKQWTEIKER